jgi:nicotinate-nucleotide--dimethylbenzimidazole phosphoribosyltransferase
MSLTLILGGVRSGKSARAERLAAVSGRPVRFVGTAAADDQSMAARIAAHQARRPAAWETVIAGDDLAACVRFDAVTLLDGLGGWIAGRDRATVEAGTAGLVAQAGTGELIVVAEQAGSGLLPLDRVAREWLDLLGEMTATLAEAATRVELVIAGRVLELPAP